LRTLPLPTGTTPRCLSRRAWLHTHRFFGSHVTHGLHTTYTHARGLVGYTRLVLARYARHTFVLLHTHCGALRAAPASPLRTTRTTAPTPPFSPTIVPFFRHYRTAAVCVASDIAALHHWFLLAAARYLRATASCRAYLLPPCLHAHAHQRFYRAYTCRAGFEQAAPFACIWRAAPCRHSANVTALPFAAGSRTAHARSHCGLPHAHCRTRICCCGLYAWDARGSHAVYFWVRGSLPHTPVWVAVHLPQLIGLVPWFCRFTRYARFARFTWLRPAPVHTAGLRCAMPLNTFPPPRCLRVLTAVHAGCTRGSSAAALRARFLAYCWQTPSGLFSFPPPLRAALHTGS